MSNYEILDMEQGSPEWLEFKQTHIGGSEVGIILGHNPYRTPHDLWLEKIGAQDPQKVNEAMLRGQALEPNARDCYIERTGIAVVAKTVQYIKWDILMASLDGWTSDGTSTLEAKCPYSRRPYDQAKEDKYIPQHYFDQMQTGLLITEADFCDYVVYLNDKEMEVIRVYPDHKYMQDALITLKEFWKMVVNRTPPTRVEGDPLFKQGKESDELAQRYKEAKLKAKENEIEVAKLADELKVMMGEEKKVIFGTTGVTAMAYEGRNIINYKKLIIDYDINDSVLEGYTTKSADHIRFKIKESK